MTTIKEFYYKCLSDGESKKLVRDLVGSAIRVVTLKIQSKGSCTCPKKSKEVSKKIKRAEKLFSKNLAEFKKAAENFGIRIPKGLNAESLAGLFLKISQTPTQK